MTKAKEFIKGCILCSVLSMIFEMYNYYTTSNESFVFLSMLAGSALACSIIVWKELKNQDN